MGMAIPKSIVIQGLKFAGVSGLYLARLMDKLIATKSEKTLTVLDIGSGGGRPWSVASIFLKDKASQISLTAIDAVPPKTHGFENLREPKKFKQVRGTLFEALSKTPDSSYDLVVCMDVIEHLSRDDGYRLIYEMNRLSKGAFGLSCPNGFAWQPPSKENPFQAHISGWSPEDFREIGFRRVRGHHGLKATTNSFAKKAYPLNLFTGFIYAFETLIAKLLPSTSALLWIETLENFETLEQDGPGMLDQFVLGE